MVLGGTLLGSPLRKKLLVGRREAWSYSSAFGICTPFILSPWPSQATSAIDQVGWGPRAQAWLRAALLGAVFALELPLGLRPYLI